MGLGAVEAIVALLMRRGAASQDIATYGCMALATLCETSKIPSSSNYPSLITEICHKGFAG